MESSYDEVQEPLSLDHFFSLLTLPYKRIDLSYFNLRFKLKELDQTAKALEINTTLQELNLTATQIRDFGATSLSRALKINTAISTLSLFGNNITDLGAKAVAEALKVNDTLTKLDLGSNEITDVGIQALAEALRVNKALAALQLEQNMMGDAGAASLAQALMLNTALASLDIFDNNVGEAGASAFLETLAVNHTLTSINIDDDALNSAAIESSNEKAARVSVTRKRLNKNVKGRITEMVLKNRRTQQTAFIEALSSTDKAPWMRSKLLLIGEGAAGKTATKRSLLNEGFDEEWKSTVGIAMTEARTYSNTWKKHQGAGFTMTFVTNLAASHFDDSEHDESGQANNIGRRTKSSFNRPLRRKSEMEIQRRPSEKKKLERLISNYEFNGYLLVRAKNNMDSIRTSIWDFGGQTVFYTLHPLCFTKYGVYLLVFSMQSLLEDATETATALEFWLNSVHMHAPEAPVLIAGTFLDQVSTDEFEDCTKIIRKFLDDRFLQVQYNADICFFPIDNKGKIGVSELRNNIEKVTREQRHVQYEVSRKWMECLDEMLGYDCNWIGLSKVKKLVNAIDTTSTEELDRMLSLFHELGVILHFNNTQSLRQVVTTKPQWLVDALSKVIRDGYVHSFDAQQIEAVGLQEDVDNMFNNGLVSRDLLEFLWQRDQVDFLLDLLRKLLLLSAWNFKGEEDLYLVPSLARSEKSTISPEEGLKKCQLSFSFLPNGVFERFVCQCVAYSSNQNGSKEPVITSKVCRIWFGGSTLIYLTRGIKDITVHVSPESAAARCLGIFMSMLRKLREDVLGDALRVEILLQKGRKDKKNYKMVPYRVAKRKRSYPWFQQTTLSNESEIENKFISL